MKNIDTRITYLAGLKYVLLPTICLLLFACAQQEAKEVNTVKDIEFQASEQAIVTPAKGYALRFQTDGIYMQTPDDVEDWRFKIGGTASQENIQVDEWNENELWYRNIYPNINLRFYDEGKGNAGYNFLIKAGGKPDQICLELEGKQTPYIAPSGELILPTEKGEIRHSIPYTYQEINGKREVVASKYKLENGCLGFEIGDYNTKYNLIIN